jgi:hypothetical protein
VRVFADEFFYVALINRRNEHHARVMAWADTFEGDCISFAMMKEERLSDALIGDRHFEQAGFRALLTDS